MVTIHAPPHRPAASRVQDPAECEIDASTRFLFLHIPKAGGSTLAAALQDRFSGEATFPPYYSNSLRGLDARDIDPFRYFRGHFFHQAIVPLLPPDTASVTMLRNPVDRFASQFGGLRFAQAEAFRDHRQAQELELIRGMSLDEFTEADEMVIQRRARNMMTRMLGAELDGEAGAELTSGLRIPYEDDCKADLETAWKRLLEFTAFGITERFQDSLDLFCFVFGWRPNQYALLNVAEDRPVPDLGLAARIAERNSLDVELYERAIEVLDRRHRQMSIELLRRYGSHDEAELELPLSPDVTERLLNRHYEERVSKTYLAPVKSIEHSLEKPASGPNWYPPQWSIRHGWYRWTGPGTVSDIDFPIVEGDDLRLRVQVVHALDDDILIGMRVLANGDLLSLDRRCDGSGATSFEGELPQASIDRRGGFLRVSFEVERTILPASIEPANQDPRSLGVAISRVEIETGQ